MKNKEYNTIDSINKGIYQTEKRICEKEDRHFNITLSEENEGKKNKKELRKPMLSIGYHKGNQQQIMKEKREKKKQKAYLNK